MSALKDAGEFKTIQRLDYRLRTDADLYQRLRSLDLLVADVSCMSLMPLYYAAHSLLVPTIRLHTTPMSARATSVTLPPLLQGHPAGYEHDLLGDSPKKGFRVGLIDRAKAVMSSAKPIIGFNQGRTLLYQRTYPKPNFVFISHDEKGNQRTLVSKIVQQCETHGINVWEYAVENDSGVKWRAALDDALSKTTHMVCLLSPSYEFSKACKQELTYALERRDRVQIFGFLTNGRINPNVEIGTEWHQKLLNRSDAQNAKQVINTLVGNLVKST